MAPNTKQLSLIVKHLSAADLGVQKPVFAPLTQESNLSAPQEACHDVCPTRKVRCKFVKEKEG